MTDNPEYLQVRDLHKAINADVLKKAVSRGTQLPWLKDMTGQFEDPEYTELTLAERGLLKDLRLLAARRGNKILNDEKYLRVQLRCSTRTALATKLHRLRQLRFLEPYNPATNEAAKLIFPSHIGLYENETDVSPTSRLDVEVDKDKAFDLEKSHIEANGTPTTQVANAVQTFLTTYCIHLPDEDTVRDELVARFHLDEQAIDEAQETWRRLRAEGQGSASS